jgi:hypothetical protein
MDVVFCKRWGGQHTAATAINPGPAAPPKTYTRSRRWCMYSDGVYIFNGTYSAKGSFVKELNIYLKKESFLFKNYLHLDIFAYLSNFIFLKVFPP